MRRKVILGVNDLATTNPELLEEWDYDKNSDTVFITAHCGSNKKAWWKCKTCGHSWQAAISNRTRLRTGCPVCAGRAVGKGINDLETLYPEIAKELNTEKNGIKACDITAHNNRKVWWKCIHCNFEWEASVKSRTKYNNRCPACKLMKQKSKYEEPFRISQTLLSKKENELNKKAKELNRVEDILNMIEEREKELSKREAEINKLEHIINTLDKKEKELSRREEELNRKAEILTKRVTNLSIIGISNNKKYSKTSNVKNKTITTKDWFIDHSVDPSKTIKAMYPDLVEEWDYEKNGELTPENTTYGSKKVVWWYCKKHKHSYQMQVKYKVQKKESTGLNWGCPQCVGNYSKRCDDIESNNITITHPHLLEDWDYEKNGDLKPERLTRGSSVRAWWKCKVCGHEWQTAIHHRTGGQGCKQCNARKRQRRVICTETGKGFDSIADAHRETGTSLNGIYFCCSGRTQTAGGYHWKYADDNNNTTKT